MKDGRLSGGLSVGDELGDAVVGDGVVKRHSLSPRGTQLTTAGSPKINARNVRRAQVNRVKDYWAAESVSASHCFHSGVS